MMNRIKEIRKQQKVSQDKLANVLNMSRQAISHYERGDREPKLATWQKLADFFGVSVLTLMSDDEQPEVTLKNDVPTEVIYKGKKYKVITNE
ncbi:helix-turn-helix domain-containing protein [Fructobacillus fructosus]|uniref:helix-turn-helix domain-containing protein n=1 Tax=Fructobacillus fructosus TaxID=1631 RepID=UPI0040342FC1